MGQEIWRRLSLESYPCYSTELMFRIMEHKMTVASSRYISWFFHNFVSTWAWVCEMCVFPKQCFWCEGPFLFLNGRGQTLKYRMTSVDYFQLNQQICEVLGMVMLTGTQSAPNGCLQFLFIGLWNRERIWEQVQMRTLLVHYENGSAKTRGRSLLRIFRIPWIV